MVPVSPNSSHYSLGKRQSCFCLEFSSSPISRLICEMAPNESELFAASLHCQENKKRRKKKALVVLE